MAPTDFPGDGQHNGNAGRQVGKRVVDAARAELARVAVALEHDATERITMLKDLLDQAAEQDHALVERLDGLDEREAEFTRRLREGLHEVDSTIAERLREVRQLRAEFEPALDDAASERVAELAQKVDDLRGGLREIDSTIADRLEEVRRLRDEREKNAFDESAAAERVADLVQKVDEQQHSFAEAIKQRERQFEGALQQQRKEVERELQRRSGDLQRAADEQVEMIQYAAADKTAEIHWLSAEHRGGIEQAAAARSAELEELARQGRTALEDATTVAKVVTDAREQIEQQVAGSLDDVQRVAAEEAAAFEELADKMFGELEAALRRQFEVSHSELVDEARRVLDSAVEHTDQTRSLSNSIDTVVARSTHRLEQMAAAEADRLEQEAGVTRDDVRRFAVEEAAAFKDVAGERVAELRYILTDHAELLAELTRLHESTSAQVLEARGLMNDLLQHGVTGRVSDPDAALAASASRYEARLRAVADEQARALEATAAATRNELRDAQPGRIAWDAEDRSEELEDALAAASSRYEARLRAIAEEERHALEYATAVGKKELRDAQSTRITGAAGDRGKEFEAALAAAVSGHEARLRAVAEEERRAFETAAAATRSQLRNVDPSRIARVADDRGREFETSLAAAASGHEARLRAVAEEERRSLEAVGSVTKDDLLHALRRAEEELEQAVKAQESDLGEMIVAARTTLEQLSSQHVDELDMTAGALRIGIEELQRDIEAALKQSGDNQVAALNRAAAAWLRRINRVGKKRSRSGLRRTGPSATAVMLAIAAAFGGTMLFRGGGGGGGGNSNVAAATTQVSRPKAPVNPSATVTPPDAGANQDPSAIHWTAPQTGSRARTGSSPAGGAPGSPGAASPSGAAPAQPGSPPSSPPPSSPSPSNPPPSGGGGGPLGGVLDPILAPATTLPSP